MNSNNKPLAWLYGEIKTPPFSQSARLENRKKKRLEEKGWKVGTAQEFLGLSPAEAEYLELKLRSLLVLGATKQDLARIIVLSKGFVSSAL